MLQKEQHLFIFEFRHIYSYIFMLLHAPHEVHFAQELSPLKDRIDHRNKVTVGISLSQHRRKLHSFIHIEIAFGLPVIFVQCLLHYLDQMSIVAGSWLNMSDRG